MKKKSIVGLLAFCATSLVGVVASAQSFPFQGLAKDTFPACAQSVANGGGSTFAIGCSGAAEGTVWKRSSTAGWSQFSAMQFKQITVSGAGVPWGLKANGTVWKFSTVLNTWQQKGQAGTCLIEIGAGSTDNDVWGLGCFSPTADASVWRFNGTTFSEPQTGARAAHIAIGSNSSTPWALHSTGLVFKWNGTSFGTSLPGCATAIGGNGWAVGCGDRKSVWLYNSGNSPTLRASNPTALKGIGSNGLTALDDSGSVFLQSKLTSFTAASFLTLNYAVRIKGAAFTPNKGIRLFHQHPTLGWREVGISINSQTTLADGTINHVQSAFDAGDCRRTEMRSDPNVYRQMPLRLDIADGASTYFVSPAIYDACSGALLPP